MTEPKIKSASTVVVCENEHSWPPRILLLKRSTKASFLPGAHVFPGGQIDEADLLGAASMLSNVTLLQRMGHFFSGQDHLTIAAHLLAAARETKEEASIRILPTGLHPLSWWVTPPGETRRFNTWFFLAFSQGLYNQPQSSPEVMQPAWLSPEEALELYELGHIFLAPPTRSILERMTQSSSCAEFLSFVDQPLRPIHPQFITNEQGKKLLILPGHELHLDKIKSNFISKTYYYFP